MILVNNPGSWSHVYAPLLHAEWHGWTPTDLIFPFFLFIVGTSIAFSQKKHTQLHNRRFIYLKIVRRTLILFFLGLLLSGFPRYHFSEMRIPGVLQRIAVVYFFAAVIALNTRWKAQAWLACGLLLLYWALMKWVPVPGSAAGDLSPEGNLAAYIDRLFLSGHLWKQTWDPEGMLSTLPAIATALTGVLTGHWLLSGNERKEVAGWMFAGGWMAIVAGLGWGMVFPINKSLWTSSYVLFTSGAALQFLGMCYWLIDVKGFRKWATPAIIYGMNAIAVFVLSALLARILIIIKIAEPNGETISLKGYLFRRLFLSWADPVNASLAFAVFNVLFWLALMTLLYRKRIFIKI